MTRSQEIIDFWFGTDAKQPLKNSNMWWKKDPAVDLEIKKAFGNDLESAANGSLDAWRNELQGSLAFIIITDQFSRNMYRDTPTMFFYDELALTTSLMGQDKGYSADLSLVQRWFYYMPMMHSESLIMQQRSIETYRRLADESVSAAPEVNKALENTYDFALRHFEIVESFGRFPHRNVILGRKSTPAEQEFLGQPGSSF